MQSRLPVLKFVQIYISHIAEHGKFLQYLTIIIKKTCISSRNLMKMQITLYCTGDVTVNTV